MERLTEKAPRPSVNSQYVKRKGFYTADCIERLGIYEDTGLTPEQIQKLKERDTAKAPEVFDGHWYKCPTCGMYAGGLKGDFCHRCGQRLKWEVE